MPATEEFFNRRGDGLRADCRTCRALTLEAYRRRNKVKIAETDRLYRESHREQRREWKREWQCGNRERAMEHTERYRQEHAERYADATKAKDAMRRARKRNAIGSYSADDVRRQYDRQQGKCYWCGKRMRGSYHADHVVPLALGGSNHPSNIVAACAECNMQKCATHPMDFAGVMF
jgi:hypothetical protein